MMITRDQTIQRIGEWVEQTYQQFGHPQVAAQTSTLICETAGEVLWPDWCNLLDRLNLTADGILIDLGSGDGKACIFAALLTQVGKIIGYEFSIERCAVANKMLQLLEQAQIKVPVEIIEGDLTKLWHGEGTVIYLCATCFTTELIDHIAHKINQTTSIHTVLSLRPLTTLRRLKFLERVRVHCSWDNAYVYIYK